MNSKANIQRRLELVTRRPRCAWVIPRLRNKHLTEEQGGEVKLKALRTGTTPQGREIVRRILYSVRKLLLAREHTHAEIVDIVLENLRTFKDIQPEFAVVMSVSAGGKVEHWLEATPRGFAILVTLWMIKETKREPIMCAPNDRPDPRGI